MPKVTQAIISFLTARLKDHPAPDLLDRYLQHAPNMETQVNVAQGKGERVDGKSYFTDGVNEWFNIRIPKDADSTPHFRDYELRFTFDEHAEAIGSTGLDWRHKVSRWFGFDFDAMIGHAKDVGIADDELERVKVAACALPWVEVRRSTSGNGIHLYVIADDHPSFAADNHTIHSQHGHSILAEMSRQTGFDFQARIDACGGNTWLWKRIMGPNGFEQIKAATETLKTLPGWTALPPTAPDDEPEQPATIPIKVFEDAYEQLSKPFPKLEPTARHLKIIEAIRNTGFACSHDPEKGMWIIHSGALAKINPAFDARSACTKPDEHNCCISPTPSGFRVTFYQRGIVDNFRFPEECGLNIRAASDLFSRDPDVRENVIEGILQIGDLAGINGATKTFKSWFVMQMGICVATGIPFLGRSTTQGKVLLLDAELHDDTIHRRINLVSDALGVDRKIVGRNFHFDTLRYQPRDVYQVCKELAKLPPNTFSLIIVDPQYRLYPEQFDENSNSDATRFMAEIVEATGHQNCAIVATHHQSKGSQAGRATRDLGSGAGAFARIVDWHCGLVPHQDEDAIVMKSNLRALPPIKDFCLERDGFLWKVAPGKDPRATAVTGNNVALDDFLKTISTTATLRKVVSRQCRQVLNITVDQFEDLIARAVEAGHVKVCREANNKPYMVQRVESSEPKAQAA